MVVIIVVIVIVPTCFVRHFHVITCVSIINYFYHLLYKPNI